MFLFVLVCCNKSNTTEKNRIYETPKKTYGEANYSNQGIIDLSKSSSSEEFNDVKVSSMTTSASSKRKGNGWASLGSSQFKKIKNEDKANKQVNLTTVNSYSGWKDLVLKDTHLGKKRASVFKKIIKMLQSKARDRHSKNIEQDRNWGNHYLQALESLIKCAWVFETVPNLVGDLKSTFKGIGPSCEKLIQEETKKHDGEYLWIHQGANENNSELLKFIEDRTKLDTCKPLLTFLRDNPEVVVDHRDDITEVFKRDLDIQMLLSGFWFQKHNEIVNWKKW